MKVNKSFNLLGLSSNMNIQHIEATNLSDAWFQTIFKILDEGEVFTIDRGSYAGQKRLEFDWVTVHVNHPNIRPLIPQIEPHFNIPNPVADDYLDDYLPKLMTGVMAPEESYTYGQRLTEYPIRYPLNIKDTGHWPKILIEEIDQFVDLGIIKNVYGQWFLNQIELMIWVYKNKGYRNNQMVLQVAHPTDMMLQDPPCLRHIDTRIQNGKLHFYPYFRSWDLWGGFPANLGGIQLLKEYCSGEIGIEDGDIVATSKGLHIYEYAFELAKTIRMKQDIKLKGD